MMSFVTACKEVWVTQMNGRPCVRNGSGFSLPIEEVASAIERV